MIAGGRSGTLGEFSIAYDEGKLIGVLEGTGGITSEIKTIVSIIRKKTGAKVIYDADPQNLVRKLIEYYRRKHFKHPTVHHPQRKNQR